jgi:iron-regulated transporter 1
MQQPLLPVEAIKPAAGQTSIRWRALIFCSHLASAWGERMWEFSAGLLLLALGGGESLQLPSALAFCMLLTQVFLGPMAGRLVDGGHPLRTPLAGLAGQQVGIALAAVSAAVFLNVDLGGRHNVLMGACCIIGFSCLATFSALVSKLSVENHWAVSLSNGIREDLVQLNSQMRRIDLSCKIMAPMFSGLLMTWYSPAVSGCTVALINVLAWPIEAICLRAVFADPWCRRKLLNSSRDVGSTPLTRTPAHYETAPSQSTDGDMQGEAWSLYFSQKGLWQSALALAMLHLTVLSFDQQMTAYVVILGVSPAVISVYRGVGEIFGLAATFAAPWLVKALGWSSAYSAFLFIWIQLACLTPSAIGASDWAKDSLPALVSASLLNGGVGVSRLGLWGFDLAVSQMLQEQIDPPSARGAVMGVQKSLEASFGTLAALSGIVFPAADQFQYLAFGSWMAVCSAALLHTSTLARR